MPDQKFIYILWQSQTFFVIQKRLFAFSKFASCAGTKVFEEALYAVKFLGWHKIFGPAQNILGPVGRGICTFLVLSGDKLSSVFKKLLNDGLKNI